MFRIAPDHLKVIVSCSTMDRQTTRHFQKYQYDVDYNSFNIIKFISELIFGIFVIVSI